MKKILLILPLLFWFGCEKEEPEDCAGVIGGNNMCGCTDSTAMNYDSEATYDDGSCDYEPSPIYNFVARYILDEVVIRWSSNFDADFLSFVIEKSENSLESDFVEIAEIPMNELGYYQQVFNYSDTDIVKDRRYYYRIIKSDSASNYSESNVVTASSYAKFSFYVHSKDRVYTVDSDGENIEEIVKFNVGGYFWSPDKTKMLIRTGTKTLIADYSNYIDWNTIESPFLQMELPEPVYWSLNEDRIFFWNGYGDVSYWVNVDGSNLTEFPLPGPYDYIDVNMNPVNDYVAYIRYSGQDQGLNVLDPNGNLIWQMQGGGNPQWSRSGDKIVFNDYDGNNRNLFIINSDGTGLHQITNFTVNLDHRPSHSIGESVWSYDEKFVLCRQQNSNNIIIVDMEDFTDNSFSTEGQFPIWIENNYLAFFKGNSNREIIISNMDSTDQEIIVVLPDSLSNPGLLHYIPN